MTAKQWFWAFLKLCGFWLIVFIVGFMLASAANAAAFEEKRLATAQFRQVEGCIETSTLVTLVQNTVVVSNQWPDGWARAVWITIERNDTCAGLQLLNAAGQVTIQDATLTIDRKLDSAVVTAWITVWDGISQSEGRLYVVGTWAGIGTVNRSVWRTVSRSAEAVLTVDGLVQLRNATTDAQLTITK